MEFVTANQIVSWVVIFAFVAYFIYKEWPEFWKRVSARARKEYRAERQDKTVDERLEKIEESIKGINEKLARDYIRINDVDQMQRKLHSVIEDMLEEQEIIMRALLGTLGGLQELGANGPTMTAKEDILAYLNKKVHQGDNDDDL